jgi:hypothetical protein
VLHFGYHQFDGILVFVLFYIHRKIIWICEREWFYQVLVKARKETKLK